MRFVGDILVNMSSESSASYLGYTLSGFLETTLAYFSLTVLVPEVKSKHEVTPPVKLACSVWQSAVVSALVGALLGALFAAEEHGINYRLALSILFLGDTLALFSVLFVGLSIRSALRDAFGSCRNKPCAVTQVVARQLAPKLGELQQYSLQQWRGLAEYPAALGVLLLLGYSLGKNQDPSTASADDHLRWVASMAATFPALSWVMIRFPRCIALLFYSAFLAAVFATFAAAADSTDDAAAVCYAALEILVSLTMAAATSIFFGLCAHEKTKLVDAKDKLAEDLTQAKVQIRTMGKKVEDHSKESRIFSHMSHELKSPLNVILGFAGLLQTQNLDEEGRVQLGHIQEAGGLLLKVVVDLLDMLRCRARKLVLRPQSTELAPMFHELCSQIKELGRGREVEVSWKLDPMLPRSVWLDPVKLAQLVHNLGSNVILPSRIYG
ncbi:unnamed protein product [Chrysoparadoxa australica]